MANTSGTKYGLKRVVNASGRMSILGVSSLSDRIVEAMKVGGQQYVEMTDLMEKSGEYIARKLGAPSAVVVNSASSGIALSVAALVTCGKERLSARLHQETIDKNEVILLKGHNVQYGAPIETMVALGGGKVVEVGYANEGRAVHITDAIHDKTAAILYVQSHHAVQKNMISLAEVKEISETYQVPLIVDAAAEEDLGKYAKMGDLVIFSGSKALEGPTSGIVVGQSVYIEWLRVQLHAIGRSMKVGKETVFGLLQALDDYQPHEDRSDFYKAALRVLQPLEKIPGVKVTIVQDEAGRSIYRGRITINEAITGVSAIKTVAQLQQGEIAIYTRDYGARQGFFDIDPRPLQEGEIELIYERIAAILGGKLT